MFNSIASFFNTFLYQPLFNILVLLYNYLPGHDFGIAVILLTLIIKVILFPLSLRAVKSQRSLQALQPKLQAIQEKYKNDKERQAKEILDIYKNEKINPFSGLFLGLIQLPILIALYWVCRNGLNPKELANLYPFVANPGSINAFFLGLVDLSKPNFIFALIAGVLQYFQTKMLLPKQTGAAKNDFSQAMQSQMTYFFPVFTVIILINLPSALGLYWTANGLFSIIQQYIIINSNESKRP